MNRVSLTRRAWLAAVPWAAACRRTKPGFRGYAYIATATRPAVVVVDMAGFAVRWRVELESPPSLLVNNPAQPFLYALLPQTRAVQEVDARQMARGRKAVLRGTPVLARLAPDGSALWVATRNPAALVAVPLETLRPRDVITLPADPLDFDLSADPARAAVLLANRTLMQVDLAGPPQPASATLGQEPGLVHYRGDGRQILVAERAERLLTILDAATLRVVVQLPLALRPDRWCFKRDGGQLFITGEGRDAVVVAYPYQTQIAQTSLSGHAPGAMADSGTPEYLFVANPSAGSVTIFDIGSQRVVAVTTVGREPSEILITPDDQYALVINRGSGDLAVIRIANIQPGRSRRAALFTMIPVGDMPVSGVVRNAT